MLSKSRPVIHAMSQQAVEQEMVERAADQEHPQAVQTGEQPANCAAPGRSSEEWRAPHADSKSTAGEHTAEKQEWVELRLVKMEEELVETVELQLVEIRKELAKMADLQLVKLVDLQLVKLVELQLAKMADQQWVEMVELQLMEIREELVKMADQQLVEIREELVFHLERQSKESKAVEVLQQEDRVQEVNEQE